jgi:gas vesicle protein GvpL/GvpF
MPRRSRTSRSRSRRTIVRNHLYVYAVVAGRPNARALTNLPTLPGGSVPRILPLDSSASLVVADVPAESFDAKTIDARLKDLDWLSRCGAAHHAVPDALIESHAVIPLRLFTLFSTEVKALSTFRKSKARVARALARVKGRQEWVLRIGRPDPGKVVAHPEVRTTPPGRGDGKSGTSFLHAKADVKRGRSERARRVAAEAARVFERLDALADASTARPITPGTSLLLDAAFLVSKRRTAALQRTLTKHAQVLLDDGCPISFTGPWPPYSFASID